MAQVKVVGKVSKVFGASGQGLDLLETYKGQTGEDYTRTWTVWFAVAHNIEVDSDVTVTGLFSNKIEKWVDLQGNPVNDKTGNPGQSIKLAINNAVVAPKVSVAFDLPF
jgi:hypothetical protein